MRYRELLAESDFLDVVNDHGGYSEPEWHDGFWIDDRGDVLACDYENDVHHADLVSSMKTEPDEEFVEAATRHGWVRVRIVPGRDFMVELNPKAVRIKALRVLARAIREADVTRYIVEKNGSYEVSNTAPQFIGMISRMVERASSVVESGPTADQLVELLID